MENMSKESASTALSISPTKIYDDIFALAADIKEKDAVARSNCKLCGSEYRTAAEEYWLEKKQSVPAVVRFLEEKGEKTTYKAVNNHMQEHYAPHQSLLSVKRYVEKLRSYATLKEDKIAMLSLCRTILLKEMLEIGAEGDQLPFMERRKNAEILTKLQTSILACDEQERKINEDWKPARIIVEKLQQIIQVQLVDATENEKRTLAKVVETLFNEVEHVKFDK